MTTPIPVARRRFRLRLSGHPRVLYAGLYLTIFWFILALGADVIAPFDPNAQDISNVLDPPSLTHWFGTDNFGRDVLSRVIHGTRVDLQMGLIGVILPFLLGTVVGALSGYFGRLTDIVLMRILDVMLSFPWLVLLIAIITVLRPGLRSFYIAITLVGWVSYARLVRTQTLVLKNSDFVHAAVSIGMPL